MSRPSLEALRSRGLDHENLRLSFTAAELLFVEVFSLAGPLIVIPCGAWKERLRTPSMAAIATVNRDEYILVYRKLALNTELQTTGTRQTTEFATTAAFIIQHEHCTRLVT